MRIRLNIALVVTAFMAAACEGPPPTLFVMEVTRVVVVTATPPANELVARVAANLRATEQALTETPPEPTLTPTPTQDPVPTPVIAEIFVAEQRFENGRMLWLQPVDQLWVLTTNEDGEPVWSIHEDTFEDGQPELDPDLIPPDEDLRQPIRGFGKLWRENLEIREKLGWAIEPETGEVTRYEYHSGGTVDEENEFIPGFGYHVVESVHGDIIRFFEGESTWEIEDD